MILTEKKHLYAFGSNEGGKCGVTEEDEPEKILVPKEIVGLNKYDIYTGANHSFYLDYKGRLYGWGENTYGQLGLGANNTEKNPIPKEVKFNEKIKIKSICGGNDHTIALDSDFNVYSWGRNDENQLGFLNQYDKGLVGKVGDDRNLFECTPIKLTIPNDAKVTAIVARDHSSYAYSDSAAFSWGSAQGYILGDKKEEGNEKTPFQIPSAFFKDQKISQISLGSSHVCVVLYDPKYGCISPKFDYEEEEEGKAKAQSPKKKKGKKRNPRVSDDDKFKTKKNPIKS
ncbi:MAG: hypothetical protein MJ252_29595 [archaeon]|nr:hypothetical protein [archaeon]